MKKQIIFNVLGLILALPFANLAMADNSPVQCPHMYRASKRLLAAQNQLTIRLTQIDPNDQYAQAALNNVKAALDDVAAGMTLRNCMNANNTELAQIQGVRSDENSLQCFIDRPHRVSALDFLNGAIKELTRAAHGFEGERAIALQQAQDAAGQMVSDISDDANCSLVVAPPSQMTSSSQAE